MDADRYLESLRDDRDRLIALDGVDLGLSVPTCPDWDLAKLFVHVGRVNRWAMVAMELAPDADFPRFGPRPEEDARIIDWLRDGLDHLIAYLDSTDLDAPCWSFMGPSTRRFWARRQALEVAVHRFDAELAARISEPTEPDADLAADGVEEWLDNMAGRWYSSGATVAGSLHLHATDGEGEWLIEVDGDRFQWHRGHHKGDVAIRAPRADLFLLAWRRREVTDVEVLGDAALLDAFLAQVPVS